MKKQKATSSRRRAREDSREPSLTREEWALLKRYQVTMGYPDVRTAMTAILRDWAWKWRSEVRI